jgi:hypothetical protein
VHAQEETEDIRRQSIMRLAESYFAAHADSTQVYVVSWASGC